MLRAAKKCHCYGCSLDLKFLLYRAFVVGFVNDLVVQLFQSNFGEVAIASLTVHCFVSRLKILLTI